MLKGNDLKEALLGADSLCRKAVQAPAMLNEAYEYSLPSSFSRGILLDIGRAKILLISGTASVDEHGKSIHIGDFRQQTRRTFANIAGLLLLRWKDLLGRTLFVQPAICEILNGITPSSMKSGPRSTSPRA